MLFAMAFIYSKVCISSFLVQFLYGGVLIENNIRYFCKFTLDEGCFRAFIQSEFHFNIHAEYIYDIMQFLKLFVIRTICL